MRKAVLKRIKITKGVKILHRHAGLNHFNAKMSRKKQMRQKHMITLKGNKATKIKQYLMQ